MSNQAPVVQTNIAYQTVNEDSPFSFKIPVGTFVDLDGDALIYSATLSDVDPDTNAFLSLPSWLTMDETGQFHGTPTNDDVLNGPYYIRVAATDSSGASSYDYFELTINNTPDEPIYNGDANIPVQHATQSALFNFQLAGFHDVDPSASLSYSAKLADGSALPAWLSFNTNTLTFSGTPSNNDGGVKTVQVTAVDSTDGTGFATSVSFVLDINHAPTSVGFAPLSFTEDSLGIFDVATPFNDVDAGAVLSYSVTKADGSALPTWLSFTAVNATTGSIIDDVLRFAGTPFNSHVGSFDVKVTANDGRGGILSNIFSINVINTNDAPVLVRTIPDTTATENDTNFNYTVQTFFKDVDAGDTLTYSAQNVDGTPLPAWLSFDPSTGTFTGTPTLEIGGVTESNIRITATDVAGASTFDIFKIAIQHVNNAPTGAVTIDGTVAEGNILTANTTALVDKDGLGTLHYQWQVNDGSGWTNVGTDSSSFIPNSAMAKAQSNIQVIVNYNDLRADVAKGIGVESVTSNSVGPVVLVNEAPTGAVIISNATDATRGAINAQQNDVLTVSNALADTDGMDGSIVSYQWLRNGVAIDGATDTSYNLTQDDVGAVITVNATYTDNDNFSNSKLSAPSNSIINVNDAPVLNNTLENQNATGGVFFSYDVQAAASFSDVDITFGDKLTFSAALSNKALPKWLSINPNTGVLSGLPTNSNVGSINIKIVATDATGQAESDFFKLTVAQGTTVAVNHLPTGSISLVGTKAELQTLTANTSALVDIDGLNGVTLNYQWQQSTNNGVTWTAINGATAQSYTPDDTMADGGKSLRVQVSYTDLLGFSDAISSAAVTLVDVQDSTTGTALADALNGTNIIDVMYGLAGNDTLNGNVGNDMLNGGDGDDSIVGGVDNDVINGGNENDFVSGGDGNDIVSGDTGNDVVNGDNGNDTLNGGDGDDNMNGGDGSDLMNGDGGNDSIVGGTGNDTMYGGAGNDSISATAGNDSVDGGLGTDTINYSTVTATISVDLSITTAQFISVAGGTDSISGIENIFASNFADMLTGDANNNVITANGGNDTLIGGGGDDTIIGGVGIDTLSYSTSSDAVTVNLSKTTAQLISAFSGTDTITTVENVVGGNFTDKLTGNALNNDLNGGLGKDTLAGGLGSDTLTGGTGADRFILNSATGATNVDIITDFVSGSDVIGLSKTIFTVYSSNALESKVGLSANLAYNATTGVVSYDADGAGAGVAVNIAILGASAHPTTLANDFVILT